MFLTVTCLTCSYTSTKKPYSKEKSVMNRGNNCTLKLYIFDDFKWKCTFLLVQAIFYFEKYVLSPPNYRNKR